MSNLFAHWQTVDNFVRAGHLASIDAAAGRVWLVLAVHADWGTRLCWPGLTKIADLAGVSQRQAKRSIRQLVKRGMVRVTEKGGGAKPNLYQLAQVNPPNVKQTPPVTPVSPVSPMSPVSPAPPPGDTRVTPTGDTHVTQTVSVEPSHVTGSGGEGGDGLPPAADLGVMVELLESGGLLPGSARESARKLLALAGGDFELARRATIECFRRAQRDHKVNSSGLFHARLQKEAAGYIAAEREKVGKQVAKARSKAPNTMKAVQTVLDLRDAGEAITMASLGSRAETLARSELVRIGRLHNEQPDFTGLSDDERSALACEALRREWAHQHKVGLVLPDDAGQFRDLAADVLPLLPHDLVDTLDAQFNLWATHKAQSDEAGQFEAGQFFRTTREACADERGQLLAVMRQQKSNDLNPSREPGQSWYMVGALLGLTEREWLRLRAEAKP